MHSACVSPSAIQRAIRIEEGVLKVAGGGSELEYGAELIAGCNASHPVIAAIAAP